MRGKFLLTPYACKKAPIILEGFWFNDERPLEFRLNEDHE
jgi:hypothetical protein